MKFTDLHLTKMSILASKCRNDEASFTDLIELKLLMSAFQSSLEMNDKNPKLLAQLDEMCGLI
tara:strand:+ start:517 stop:705 length:189 start_codon:yes stop_codon:yes gene_type:complete